MGYRAGRLSLCRGDCGGRSTQGGGEFVIRQQSSDYTATISWCGVGYHLEKIESEFCGVLEVAKENKKTGGVCPPLSWE